MDISTIQLPKAVLFFRPGAGAALSAAVYAAWGGPAYASKPDEVEAAVRGGARLLLCDESRWALCTDAQRALFEELARTEKLRVMVLTDDGRSAGSLPPPVHCAVPQSLPQHEMVDALYGVLAEREQGGAVPMAPPLAQKVVVVDDSELLNRMTRAVLQRGGYEVTCLTNPFELYRELRAAPPDLVLVDYNIPALRGSSLIEIVRRSGVDVPMALYSNASEQFLAETARSCGAAGYIRKGVTADVLLSKVRAFLPVRPQSHGS